MPDLTLQEFNTFNLTANTVYRLITTLHGNYNYWVMNLGPGTLFLRANGDPSINNAQSETLPALVADNQIPIADGLRGLGVITDQDGVITVRVGVRY